MIEEDCNWRDDDDDDDDGNLSSTNRHVVVQYFDAVHACVVEEYIIDGDGDDDCANSSH